MATVHNWQIGRDMAYPHEGGPGGLQFAAVFNINRCIGCQTCTMACKSTWTHSPGQELMWWNNVETKPYGGFPANWDLNTLELLEDANPGGQKWAGADNDDPSAPYGSFDGVTIFEADAARESRPVGYLPTEAEWKAPNAFEDHPTPNSGRGAQLPEHEGWFFYLQRICNHCTYPGCLGACPRNAIYKRPEDGIVLVDQARCRGYRACVEACPYKKTMYRPTTGTTEKCVACYPRVEGTDPLTDNTPTETRCMTACVGKIRMQGLVEVDHDGVWVENPDSPLYYLVHEAKVALPLYAQFGTQPNVYYIPPRWVPRPYLRQMFGPGVEGAIERYSNPSRELLAVLQLFRVTQQIIFSFEIERGEPFTEITVDGRRVTLYDDTAIGFDRDGSEIVRVNVDEPVFERPDKLNSI
ncbi:MAG: nitrate oxidoreductase subunit beta [Actinomycetia bacterium]|nr:nitrate oxidoreductase subunit beta [Actinomycetes bacterium]MCP5034978.1 nitrate oxidoreductase subunit beta [Actinomycetes bacterium]